jgi:hypothetical protein
LQATRSGNRTALSQDWILLPTSKDQVLYQVSAPTSAITSHTSFTYSHPTHHSLTTHALTDYSPTQYVHRTLTFHSTHLNYTPCHRRPDLLLLRPNPTGSTQSDWILDYYPTRPDLLLLSTRLDLDHSSSLDLSSLSQTDWFSTPSLDCLLTTTVHPRVTAHSAVVSSLATPD